MIIFETPDRVDKEVVCCILRFGKKYLLLLRSKGGVWRSVQTELKNAVSKDKVIAKEVKDELGLEIKPEFLKTIYQDINSEIIAKHVYFFVFEDDPASKIHVHRKDLSDFGFFSFEETMKIHLEEDEGHCIYIYDRTRR